MTSNCSSCKKDCFDYHPPPKLASDKEDDQELQRLFNAFTFDPFDMEELKDGLDRSLRENQRPTLQKRRSTS